MAALFGGISDALHRRCSKFQTRIGGACAATDTRMQIFLFAIASVLLFFCSHNSPAFRYQEWIDPNIYMDVGRAIRDGAVLYRDVFDHKGPLLHLVFALLSVFPPFRYSMTGLYLLQCVTLSFGLHYMYRTSRRFLKPFPSLIVCFIFLFLLLNGLTYEQGGSAEELLLPMFCGAIFEIVARWGPQKDVHVRSDIAAAPEMPEEQDRPGSPAFFRLGLFFGIALTVKINLTAFFAVVILFLLLPLFRKNRLPDLGRAIARTAGGVLAALLPTIVYLTATSSFADCYDAYIRFNLSYAGQSGNSSGEMNFFGALSLGLFMNAASALFLVAGAICAFAGRKTFRMLGRVALTAAFLTLTGSIYAANRAYPYLFIPLVSFAGFGAVAIFAVLGRILSRGNIARRFSDRTRSVVRKVAVSATILLILLSNASWPETRFFRTEMTGTEKIAAMILEKQGSGRGDPVILLFSSGDVGIFQLTGTAPHLRYFYSPMIDHSVYPDVINSQMSYIKDGKADFVVFIWQDDNFRYDFTPLNAAYRVIACEEQEIGGAEYYIYLYQKQDVPTK